MTHARLKVDRLAVAEITRLPDWHPLSPRSGYPVFAFVVHHPDGPVLVDTGVGVGSELIDDLYAPRVTPVVECLHRARIDEREIAAVVVTHLHFDHCGQLDALDAPVYVQSEELAAASQPRYTIREWANIPEARVRRVDGDETLTEGLRVLATPGHTPGHQAVVIDVGSERAVIAGQCVFDHDEYENGEVSPSNLHSGEWREAAQASLIRVRDAAPIEVFFSHDEVTTLVTPSD